MMNNETGGEAERVEPKIAGSLGDLLRQYRDDTIKAVSALETKLKDTGLLENETYRLLKQTYMMNINAMQISPLVFITAVPTYYSFGYFIYGFLEGRGYSLKTLIGEEEYKKWQDMVDGKGSLQQFTNEVRRIEGGVIRAISSRIQRHFDPISPPDPNNPPDPNEPRAK
jgi:hypothetical protein